MIVITFIYIIQGVPDPWPLWPFQKKIKIKYYNSSSWPLANSHLMCPDRSLYQFKINYWTGIIKWEGNRPIWMTGEYIWPKLLKFSQKLSVKFIARNFWGTDRHLLVTKRWLLCTSSSKCKWKISKQMDRRPLASFISPTFTWS